MFCYNFGKCEPIYRFFHWKIREEMCNARGHISVPLTVPHFCELTSYICDSGRHLQLFSTGLADRLHQLKC